MFGIREVSDSNLDWGTKCHGWGFIFLSLSKQMPGYDTNLKIVHNGSFQFIIHHHPTT
jgi:hypothetical protein